MTTEHVLRDTAAELAMTFSSAPDGDVTVTITDANGDAVDSGTATVDSEDAARFTFQLDPQPDVQSFDVVWAGSWGGDAQQITARVEIVGGVLFTVGQARAFDDAALASTTTYPDAAILDARAGIAEFFQEVCGVSFIPRYSRDILDGGGYSLWLNRPHVNRILAVTLDGTALTADEIADLDVYEHGQVYRDARWTADRRNVIVEYEHGYEAVPWDIHRAALTYLRYILVTSDVSDRTITWSNELGTFRQAQPGREYPTGLPAVDAALHRHSGRVVVV